MSSTSNRRMTLSGIPSHQRSNTLTSRRDSIQPSSPSGPSKKRVIPKGRKSMIPTLGRENAPPTLNAIDPDVTTSKISHRRKSLAPNANDGSGRGDRRYSIAPPPTVKQERDPRIGSDNKVNQQKYIRDLLDFLLESGYQYPVSQKSLSRPSAKDFSNIVTFMLRMVDPNFQHGSSMKFEDEVALNFKCLGYPCNISKTALVAAGSAHTWPSLLAALTWLMERLKCKRLDSEEDILHNPNGTEFENVEDLALKSEMAFYQYLGKSYAAFLTENMQELERMEVALSDRFMRDDEVLEQCIERMSDVNASYVEKIRELEMESADLPSYMKKREDYAADLVQFHDLIRQMNEHKAALEKKVNEKNVELKRTNDQLDRMTRHVEDLKTAIAKQELSVTDVHKIESELKGLNEVIDRNQAVKEQRNKNLSLHQEELAKYCFNLDAVVTEYNTKLSELLDLPDMNSQLGAMKIRFNNEKLLLADQKQIVGVDIQNQVHSLVNRCQDEYSAKHSRAKECHHDELDKMEEVRELSKVGNEKLSIVMDKKIKCEQTLENERESFTASLSVRQRELDTMERKVNALRDSIALEEQMASYERQCAELEALRIDHSEENIAKKKAVVTEIYAACKAMNEHDEKFEDAVVQVNEYWRKIFAEVRSIKVNCNADS